MASGGFSNQSLLASFGLSSQINIAKYAYSGEFNQASPQAAAVTKVSAQVGSLVLTMAHVLEESLRADGSQLPLALYQQAVLDSIAAADVSPVLPPSERSPGRDIRPS